MIQFHYLKNGSNNITYFRIVENVKKLIHVKCLEQSLTHTKCSIKVGYHYCIILSNVKTRYWVPLRKDFQGLQNTPFPPQYRDSLNISLATGFVQVAYLHRARENDKITSMMSHTRRSSRLCCWVMDLEADSCPQITFTAIGIQLLREGHV